MRENCTYGSVRGDRLPLTMKKERCSRARLLDYNVINVEESRMIVYEVCFYFRGKKDGT